jgi:threonine dehydrogenase-like Zn-dependent dehydrogenase
VLECVGLAAAIETGTGRGPRRRRRVSRVGAPQYSQVRWTSDRSCATSPSPAASPRARAYIDELLPDVLDGRIEPGRVFDRTVGLDEVPDGYQAMADRKALKVLVTP